MEKPLLVLVGATAVGKTDLSIRLAQELNGEIISADSMQIYRYMDIGTAKPSQEERNGIPHHLIDICDPWDSFSVSQYQELAKKAIDDIHNNHHLPILTGGTGLYVSAVIDGFHIPSPCADSEFREHLQTLAAENGPQAVHSLLTAKDPTTAARIHPNNLRRVIRALEIYHVTGKTMTEHLESGREKPPYELYMFGLNRNREDLYERIDQRVDIMIEKGLIQEVTNLLSMGVSPGSTAMQALGYKEILHYLNGQTLHETLRILKRDTRRYAKRQLTWFRGDERITWFDLSQISSAAVIKHIEKTVMAT